LPQQLTLYTKRQCITLPGCHRTHWRRQQQQLLLLLLLLRCVGSLACSS
jgi:hypothetical protein